MIKLKKYQYRSVWYKKLFYYMQAGQSVHDAIAVSGDDIEISTLRKELETGKRMSQICGEDFSDVFSFVEIALIGVGEKTGKIKETFLLLSSLLKAQYQQKQKLIAAAIYPCIVLCLAFCLLLMILVVIVPKIAPLFSDLKSLPLTTSILIATSNHVLKWWWVDAVVFVCCTVFHIKYSGKGIYKRILKSIQLFLTFRVPLIKDIYILWHIEKWMQVVCICLQSNMSLYTTLQLSRESLVSRFIQNEFQKVELAVGQGNTCANSLHLMHPKIYSYVRGWESVIRSGENTGALLEVFQVCHEHTKSELDTVFDKAQKAIEPALILGVGMMVLGICLSIILPMYQLTQSINN